MNYFNVSEIVYFSILSKATSTGTQHWSRGEGGGGGGGSGGKTPPKVFRCVTSR